jgi:3-oxoacyl-[acyl-carrier-protein] synthase-1
MTILITAREMVTSLGFDAPSSCAAIRAGLSRPSPLDYFASIDEDTNEKVKVVGHAIAGFTDGFNMVGRWLRLAHGALDALRPSVPLADDAAFWSRTGLLVIVPAPNTPRFRNEDDAEPEAAIDSAFITPLLRRLKAPFAANAVAIGGYGPAALGTTLGRASGWLSRALVERVLIVAVDSLLDPLTLNWLASAHRLKTEDDPMGLMPGEAAVALLLENDAAARRRSAHLWGRLEAFATAREPNPFAEEKQNSGRGLAAAIHEVLSATVPKGSAFAGDIYSDHNGEQWRALEWGLAVHRLVGVVDASNVHHPAVSLGDVGAASGAVALCCALHDQWRNFAAEPISLVVSSSESGDVSAVAVGRAG